MGADWPKQVANQGLLSLLTWLSIRNWLSTSPYHLLITHTLVSVVRKAFNNVHR